MKTNTTSAKKAICKASDVRVRSFVNYLFDVRMMFDAANLPALRTELVNLEAAAKTAAKVARSTKTGESKEAAKVAASKAETLARRISEVEQFAGNFPNDAANTRIIIDGSGLQAEDLTTGFLKTWLPQAYNDKGFICDFRKVNPEDLQAAREERRDIIEVDGVAKERIPVVLWTANKLLQKFTAAARARKAAARYASQLEREAATAARKKAVEDEIIRKAAEIQAARAKETETEAAN